MPDFLPDRLEAGTHNIPGIAGLLEGIRYVSLKTENNILRHERALIQQMAAGLASIKNITVYVASDPNVQAGVLSFRAEQIDCEALGEMLGQKGIAVRAGLHCAPYAHRSAGTLDFGTVRISFSTFNTSSEVKRFLSTLSQITQ